MMRNSALLLFVLMVVLAACSPAPQIIYVTVAPSQTPAVIVVTATPEPSKTPSPTLVPSATPQSTPTLEVLNPHAGCLARTGKPELCAVNENAYLDAPYRLQLKAADGREVYTPANWIFVRDGGLPAYPNVMCVAGDCVVSIDSANGRLGYRSGGVMIYPRQRYLLVMRYSFQCSSSSVNLTSVRPYAVLHTSAPSTTTLLQEQSLGRASGYNENLWVIESDKRFSDVVIEAWWNVPFGICGQNSTLSIHSIELLPVASNYGGNSVTRF